MKMEFDWKRLGDVSVGRENLGEEMPVVVYRLLQFTMRDILEERFGSETAEEIFRDAGYKAGLAFAKNVLKKSESFPDFAENLQEELKKLKIGVLRIEKADIPNLSFILTVSEDLDCSGLPITGDTVCAYDEGFIAGLFEYFTGRNFIVKEIDCWATGDRTCRFTVKASH